VPGLAQVSFGLIDFLLMKTTTTATATTNTVRPSFVRLVISFVFPPFGHAARCPSGSSRRPATCKFEIHKRVLHIRRSYLGAQPPPTRFVSFVIKWRLVLFGPSSVYSSIRVFVSFHFIGPQCATNNLLHRSVAEQQTLPICTAAGGLQAGLRAELPSPRHGHRRRSTVSRDDSHQR
jgi:hypothetical protein